MRGDNQHLSIEEIEQLTGLAADVADGAMEGAMEHLDTCAQCKIRMLLSQIGELPKTGDAPQPSEDASSPCPEEARWLELAAGIMPQEERWRCLEHAALCDKCGPLLKVAIEDIGIELTKQEEAKVASLNSAQSEWQESLAARITGKPAPKAETDPKPLRTARTFAFWPRWAFSSAAALLVAVIGWWGWIQFRTPPVESLLAQAYTERRTIETRIAGAAYAPQRVTRGGAESSTDRPSSLIKADLLINENLKQHPNDLAWLHAKARVDLLDGHYDSAIQSLQRALEAKPDAPELLSDLGSAYLERAENTGNKPDFGNAVEFLEKAIAKAPEDRTIIFNHAIACEKSFFYKQAIADWEHYLSIDSTGGWADEARRRLADLQRKIQQNGPNSNSVLTPDDLLSRLANGRENEIEEIDNQVERYLDLAIAEWIPKIYSGESPDKDKLTLRRAVDGIADRLSRRHGDSWLKDFLAELDRNPASRPNIRAVANAVSMGDNTDRDLIVAAEKQFRKVGNRAGESLALFQAAQADQVGHFDERCHGEANELMQKTQVVSYSWLRIQALLESAVCTSLSDEKARKQAEEALKLAHDLGFRSLELKAMTFLIALNRVVGDWTQAWQYAADGLHQYWAGNYAPMRGYSLYAQLDYVIEAQQQWFLDVAVIREALSVIENDPHLLLRAVEHQRLAQALTVTGDLSGAEENFLKSWDLFGSSSTGDRKSNLEAEVQISLAGLDLLRNQPQKAIAQLEEARLRIMQLPEKDLQFELLRNLGLAYLTSGDERRAEENLKPAVDLAESSLQTNDSELDRFAWSRKSEPVYRASAQLKLQSAPEEAFARWEWYKAGSLRGEQSRLSKLQLAEMSPEFVSTQITSTVLANDTAVVSYAFFANRLAIWTFDGSGIRQAWASSTQPQIESLARIFSVDCADFKSNVDSLRSEGEKLYQEIVSPVERFLAGRKHVIIETDGALGSVPFAALVDGNGIYFGDRWSLSFSPGIYHLAFSLPWEGISNRTRPLIVGNEITPKLPPLPQAKQEAEEISALFQNATPFINEQGTQTKIIDALGHAEIFHFAGHAIFSPGGTGLALGDGSVLNVGKLAESSLRNVRLVVLSACSSAGGDNETFDERGSLARLLLSAGVSEIVASRWIVDSNSAGILMRDFYRQLLGGKSASDALRQAAADLRTQFPHPYYWAVFSVYGRT